MRNEKFNQILSEMQSMHDKKNTDYASVEDPLKNLKGCTRLGLDPIIGTVIRMQDKVERIENFMRNGELVNESVRDSFLDLAIYSTLAIVILEEMQNGKRKSGDSQATRDAEHWDEVDIQPYEGQRRSQTTTSREAAEALHEPKSGDSPVHTSHY